jgi:hypothetical protein
MSEGRVISKELMKDLTGILLANRSTAFNGFFSTSNTYSVVLAIKHVLVILMTVLAAARTLMIVRKKKSAEHYK